MPAKLTLPELDIVNRWVSDLSATTRTLSAEYGCSAPTITLLLRRHLMAEEINQTKKQKLSASALARDDLTPEQRSENARHARSFLTAESKERQKEILRRAAKTSAFKRKGKKLSPAHIAKLSAAHVGQLKADQHPNWRGGTGTKDWRGSGWVTGRRAARERDKNTCQNCGVTKEEAGQNMDVHHRVSFWAFSSTHEANSLSNLVCLCRSCHMKVEHGKIACP